MKVPARFASAGYHRGVKFVPTILVAVSIAFVAPFANAHITLMSPKPRNADQKDGPCGLAGDKRGTTVSTFKSGETITVQWKETVSHTGHFRISFDDNGQDGFVDPKSYTDLKTSPTVLVDDIKDKTGTQVYTQQVTLPDVECDRCTLQVIQVMTDKPPYGDGNDIYYQCADLTLSKAGTAEEDAGSTTSETPQTSAKTESGCRSSNAPFPSTEGAALLLGAIALTLGARRKRNEQLWSGRRANESKNVGRARVT